jgi:hypothetical protein
MHSDIEIGDSRYRPQQITIADRNSYYLWALCTSVLWIGFAAFAVGVVSSFFHMRRRVALTSIIVCALLTACIAIGVYLLPTAPIESKLVQIGTTGNPPDYWQ